MPATNEISIPETFYLVGDIHPIKMTFLCEYPYQTPGIYAVYLNGQTKQPERVHIPTIHGFQLDRERVFERVLKNAKNRLEIIVEQMKKEGLKTD